ncbi:hypothetical protein HK096_008775 [Nowakowskiella sp. JEL0078]|nr:hypothetical protein HK096_008775 [Nowakowskiella sp. JEL0078]
MPPKSKTEQKIKQQKVEDKTFGLKNKSKSAKVAKYVQQVQEQSKKAGNPKEMKDAEDRKRLQEAKKAAEAQQKAELKELFKPIIQQKIPFGVDPKTLLCAFFKAGQCQKGVKCKFSHDLNVERKVEKIDIYTDARDKEKENDTIDKWDTEKLELVVSKKLSDSNNPNNPTDIVCKHFLEAIEARRYGWFWECPNGGKVCKYRHALPPGYILKKKETEEERRAREESEKENEITLEQFIEEERHKLGSNLTKVTYESFTKWKKERKERQEADMATAAKDKQDAYKKFKAGFKLGITFSGKELFEFNPDWAEGIDDEDEGVMDIYEREESDGEVTNTIDHTKIGFTDISVPLQKVDLTDENVPSDEDNEGNNAGPSEPKINEDLFEDEDLDGLDEDEDD